MKDNDFVDDLVGGCDILNFLNNEHGQQEKEGGNTFWEKSMSDAESCA